jgi:hypothetical protein
LVLVQLAITPLINFRETVLYDIPMIQSGEFSDLADPASPGFHPLSAILLVMDMAGSVGFGVAAIIALVLMFNKSRRFPNWMIGIELLNAAFAILGWVLARMVPEIDPDYLAVTRRYVIGAVFWAAIWIPYMRMSKRVKATFVE